MEEGNGTAGAAEMDTEALDERAAHALEQIASCTVRATEILRDVRDAFKRAVYLEKVVVELAAHQMALDLTKRSFRSDELASVEAIKHAALVAYDRSEA